jgi:hypothetical protein
MSTLRIGGVDGQPTLAEATDALVVWRAAGGAAG